MKILRIAFLSMIALASCSRQPEVAVVVTGDCPEQKALAGTIRAQGFECDEISLSDDPGKYDVVWYHRPDTTGITPDELAFGEKAISYTQKGGRLVLSMDAVRLSNAWGLEDTPVETECHEAIDDGFGRKVGYHAYRSHPLFDDMFGGAYVWHGKQDNSNRVLGYFGDSMPSAEGTRIIATLWEYIFYHPYEKVIWEQPVGKGSILSIGCFLYYTQDNFHRSILERFTSNVIAWMSGAKSDTPARYWTYEPAEVVFDEQDGIKAFKAAAPAKWNVADDPDALSFAPNRNEVTLPTRRCMVVTEERSGIKEIWTHPIMSLRDYTVAVTLENGETVRLEEPSAEVELRFNSLIREFTAGDVKIREIIVPDTGSSAVVAHYEWEGGDIQQVKIGFASNMRFMWPYEENALGSLHCGWASESNCYVVHDGGDEFVSLVGADIPGTLVSQERDRDLLQVKAELAFNAAGQDACNIVMAAGNEGFSNAGKAYGKALADPQAVFAGSARFWQDYLANTVSIVTPDEAFNEGYRWATVSAGQFLAETPGLGSGLMAGYSSSLRGWGGGHRVSGRPGYAWYFGRDSEIAAFAFLSMGDYQAVKETLELLADYQGVNGTIFHELTTSGSNHFDASDATPLFVVLLAEYVKATGDIDFLKSHIGNAYKAIEFCESTDTDGDNLIEIEHVGHGWLEGGDYFFLRTEYYLSGIWARALKDASWMAELVGDNAKSEAFSARYATVRAEIENFWNPKGYYNYAKDGDGNYSTAFLALPTVPVWLGMADEEKAYTMMKGYTGTDFSTDWGVRQTNDPRPEENVGAYDECNIWPLFTGSVSLAEYCTGRYNQGFEHMMASLLCYDSATHGRVPEVLRGNSFRSGGITRHQCWSETAVTGPAIQGMLGFRADAVKGEVTIAPRLPFDWNSIKAEGLACGSTRIGIEMEKAASEIVWHLTSNEEVELQFAPAFPPATRILGVTVNGKEAEYLVSEGHEYTELRTAFKLTGDETVCISVEEGASSLPICVKAEDEGLTSGVRVLSQKAGDGILTVTVQGKPGTTCTIPVYAGARRQDIEVAFGASDIQTVEIEHKTTE